MIQSFVTLSFSLFFLLRFSFLDYLKLKDLTYGMAKYAVRFSFSFSHAGRA